jgi:hypothetical protein
MQALGFQGKLLAALQALRDPLGFRGAILRKNQGIDELSQGFFGRETEEPLELMVHAQSAERRIDDEKSVGRVLEQLLEEFTLQVRRIFRGRRSGILI